MDITVRAHSVELDDATRQYIEDKVGHAVAKQIAGQARIVIDVSEEAPSHGAPQTRVKVHATVPHLPSSTVSADETEIRAATDVAADKIGRALRKTVGRKRDKARHPGA